LQYGKSPISETAGVGDFPFQSSFPSTLSREIGS
jgi:hypothetical protein